jgi:hypothetical protein
MNNDYTKPSRIKRHLKRRWKKPKQMQGYKRVLTASILRLILCPLSQKTKVGICTPNNGHNRPLYTVVFLCPPKTQAVLCRVYSVMAGYFRQPLKRLAGSVTGSANLIYSATQSFAPLIGGYSLFNGVTA